MFTWKLTAHLVEVRATFLHHHATLHLSPAQAYEAGACEAVATDLGELNPGELGQRRDLLLVRLCLLLALLP